MAGTLTVTSIIWIEGLKIFRVTVFLGLRANVFRTVVRRVLAELIRVGDRDPAPPAHNTFLSVLVEQGIFGFTLFCALLGSLALSLRGMPPFPKRLWIVSLAVWVVGVSCLTWEMRKRSWFFFAVIIAQCG